MLVFNSEMHLLTFVVSLLEFGMFCYQLVYYLSNPKERRRFWYLILLGLLIFYNISGGLMPDGDFDIPIMVQNILAYGSGFLIASYFPYYFYRAFNLKSIRFYAVYGSVLFLLLPYFIFFGMIYPLSEDLELATSYGMIVPGLYSIVVLYKVLGAIRSKIADRRSSSHPYSGLEMVSVYAAVSPWVTMAAFAYIHIAQWIEVLVTNLGFLVITILFIIRNVKENRRREKLLLEVNRNAETVFEAQCTAFGFTKRETEVAALLCRGLSYKEIGELLYISEHTVDNHAHHIFVKAGVKRRLELQEKMGIVPPLN